MIDRWRGYHSQGDWVSNPELQTVVWGFWVQKVFKRSVRRHGRYFGDAAEGLRPSADGVDVVKD